MQLYQQGAQHYVVASLVQLSTALCYGTYPVEPSHEGGSTFLKPDTQYQTDSLAHVTPARRHSNSARDHLCLVQRLPRSSLSCGQHSIVLCVEQQLSSPVCGHLTCSSVWSTMCEAAVCSTPPASLWLISVNQTNHLHQLRRFASSSQRAEPVLYLKPAVHCRTTANPSPFSR